MTAKSTLGKRTTRTAARWVVREHDSAHANALAERLGLHPAVGRMLAARGWENSDDLADFLTPRLAMLRDPFELHDMDRAVERTLLALERGEKITVYGDYDVDGVCSTALMILTLRHLGANPGFFIPHRIHDGYGMHIENVEALANDGVKLLITVDTGVTAAREIRRATELGMDVVVTDHHLSDGEMPTEAAAVVNPNKPDALYDNGRLCGVGVAFKFAHALLKGAGRDAADSRTFLRGLMDLVALGTIADVVPLLSENRVLAHFGLQHLSDSQRPGIRALLRVTGVKEKQLTPYHVGFVMGPRLNAAGRTAHAQTALELLLTDCEERAVELANYLEMLNRRRRTEEADILTRSLEQAETQLESSEDSLLVVSHPEFHLGIVGIVASRLAERFYRPAIVLRRDQELAQGSARSIPGFDIHEALGACQSHLVTFGGHAAAAGLKLRPDAIKPFRSAINEFASDVFRTRDLTPEVTIDARVEHDEIGWPFFHDVQRLQPFGQDNPAPLFLLEGVTSRQPPRIVGTNHLKLSLNVGTQKFSAIGFNLGHLLSVCESMTSPFDIIFRPTQNTWRGSTTLELQLHDARPRG